MFNYVQKITRSLESNTILEKEEFEKNSKQLDRKQKNYLKSTFLRHIIFTAFHVWYLETFEMLAFDREQKLVNRKWSDQEVLNIKKFLDLALTSKIMVEEKLKDENKMQRKYADLDEYFHKIHGETLSSFVEELGSIDEDYFVDNFNTLSYKIKTEL